ncbi:Armadillo [Macleaya cordata]|uniref:Armadillo n=1 Tax=Macleaya cordata TaxID=56857 RepID=A0A200RD27_MACCD|nr:Armadillo [Macleaya cordata]
MEDFVEALVNGEREAQIKAAIDISELKSNQRKMLGIDHDVDIIINRLVSMLCSQDYNAIQASVLALISFASGNDRNKIRIAKSGCLPVLIGLLTDETGSFEELAIVVLLTLSSCKANKLAIAASGVVPVLLELLSRDDEGIGCNYSLQTRLDAIDTLHNLSTCQELILSVISSGTVFSLLQLIYKSNKSSKLVEKAMALLETIASSSEIGVAQIGGAEGGILALVETIESSASQQSGEHAAEVLLFICKSCREKYRELILREGAIPGLLQLRVDGTRRAKDTARTLLLLLKDSSNYGTRSRQLKNRFFERVMRGIDSDEEKLAQTTMRLFKPCESQGLSNKAFRQSQTTRVLQSKGGREVYTEGNKCAKTKSDFPRLYKGAGDRSNNYR